MADVFYKIKATVNGSTNSIDVPVVASKLAHTITINGTPFDGTDDVNLTIEGSGGTDNYDSTLANNTYQQIRNASDAGIASSIWEVGEMLPVKLSGTVGTVSLNTTLYAYIIGFDHNPTYEGKNMIHFQGFKDADGEDICLIDGIYDSSSTNGTKYFNVNHWNYYNYGGWSACDFRYDVLGSTDIEPSGYGARRYSGDVGYNPTSTCATNPVPSTLMECLPEDLRLVLKPMTKYSDNVGGATTATSNVTPTVDYLPLLGLYEVRGTLGSYENSGESSYQKQYDYYANGNTMIKKTWQDGTTGSAAYWWTRSVYTNHSTYWYYVNTSGGASYARANLSYGLSAAFAI